MHITLSAQCHVQKMTKHTTNLKKSDWSTNVESQDLDTHEGSKNLPTEAEEFDFIMGL